MTGFSRLAMRHYSVQSRDQIFVKGYELLPFARNMSKSIGKNKSKKLSSKYIQNFLIMLNNLPQPHVKLLQKELILKKAEATCDLIENKIANRITKVSETSPKNNSEPNEEETLRERFISSELKHKVTDELGLTKENY